MYRRLRYVAEYADYQRLQGNQIKEKQTELENKRQEQLQAKEEKAKLLAQREAERKEIEKQEKQQRSLVNQLQKRQRNLQDELKKQRQQSQRLNAQIDKLIEQEIAAARKRAEEAERKRKAAEQKNGSPKKKGETTPSDMSKEIPMMEEYTGDRQLSGVFEKNKGKLPMPITGSYAIVSRFGQYAVAGLKNVKLDNKGIDIKGQKGAQARAIFNGEVSAISQFGGYANVLVRHGSYISVYCNLASASVKQGQKLKTHDPIGIVATDASGNTILHFQLRKETTKLNPELWLGK
jgi:septal ring factor EnvC (AmiA/AmiB activator)